MPDEDKHNDIDTPIPDPGWKQLVVVGAVMLIGGFLAFLNPFAASLAAEAIAGAAFLAAGGVMLWQAITNAAASTRDRALTGLLGAVFVLFAVSLIVNPMAGLITLTFLVAIFFTVIGALRVGLAWHMRPAVGWGWILASGVVSLILASLIVLGLPEAALGLLGLLLGLLLGVDLTIAGVVSLALAFHKKTRG